MSTSLLDGMLLLSFSERTMNRIQRSRKSITDHITNAEGTNGGKASIDVSGGLVVKGSTLFTTTPYSNDVSCGGNEANSSSLTENLEFQNL